MIIDFRLVVVLRLRVPSLRQVELSHPHHILLVDFVERFTVVIVMWDKIDVLIMVSWTHIKGMFCS